MSIFKLNKDLFELTQLELNPSRTFTSCSNGGITGSIDLFSGKSEKILDLKYYDKFRRDIKQSLDSKNIPEYLEKIKLNKPIEHKFIKNISVQKPGTKISGGSSNSGFKENPDKESKNSYFKKSLENLNYFYKSESPYFGYSTSNYFSLNFFSLDSDPNNRALIYLTQTPNRKYSEIYDLSLSNNVNGNVEVTPFTLDFYINLRYLNNKDSYVPGTVFYIPGFITLSTIDAQIYDENDNILEYKLLLQLGTDTVNTPASNSSGTYTFKSNNSLVKDYWYRITIRWGGSFSNDSTGSIYINDTLDTNFYHSGNIIGSYQRNGVMPIIIGNYTNSFTNLIKNYFNDTSYFVSGTGDWMGSIDKPDLTFTNQFNGELHHILFSRKYYNDNEILQFSNKLKEISKDFELIDNTNNLIIGTSNNEGINNVNNFFNIKDDDILYIIPSFWYNFKKRDGFTPNNSLLVQTHPYNLYASFNKNIHNLNVENFILNYASRLIEKSAPYMHGFDLTCSPTITIEEFYNNKKNKLRNLLILPCDDGNFEHDCSFILNEIQFEVEKKYPIFKLTEIPPLDVYNKTLQETYALLMELYSDESQIFKPGVLNLKNPIKFANNIKKFNEGYNSGYFIEIKDIDTYLTDNKTIDISNGYDFQIYRKTSYDIYNDFSFFSISNLFYGNYIKENSLTINDTKYLGFSKVKITLKDNGEGCLYRADSKSKLAEWSKVGNLYKNEGFITILSPALHKFGNEEFSLTFDGNQNIYVFKLTTVLPGGKLNNSLNTTWSKDNFEENEEYVYITDINLHDNNYNVIMKAKLAQPIYKSKNDKFMIRLKYDF